MEENRKKLKRERRRLRQERKRREREAAMTPEEKFNQLLALKRATRCILSVNETYKVYVRLTEEFAKLAKEAEKNPFEGGEQCQALSEECKRKAEELSKERSEEEEYSRTVTTTVREREAEEQKKGGKAKWVVLAGIVLVVLAGICYKIPPTRYLIAGVEESLGLHRQARESYHKLGDYKDSKEREQESTYAYALSLQEEGKDSEARRAFSGLADQGYKDSAEKELVLEKKILAEAKPGEKVIFGTRQWMVLDKTETASLLILDKSLKNGVYHETAGKTSWADCSLRVRLNKEFFDKIFTEPEQEAVLNTQLKNQNNPVYKTDGGKDTTDRVFLLSADELATYEETLGGKRKNLRLRTPGRDAFATMYVSGKGEPVTYGFPVEQSGLAVRPALWVSNQ
ncbi:MAG: hypothetical protein J1F02_02075 [Lachnospiraceae bacterium]|nr:hypothetical protein [Lachnospiraceae bacterium]